jgi:two-component system OmpR family response regulator
MKILLIEDDAQTLEFIKQGFHAEGFTVDCATNGRDGVYMASGAQYDLIIVDRMLPELDGLAVVKLLRGTETTTPILFLTALDGIEERVRGLDAGGDDYLVKPFAFSELLARTRALLRRPPIQDQATLLEIADLQFDLVARRVTRAGQVLELKPREFRLLEYLLRHAGEVVTRTMLLEQVWEYHFDPRTSVVETHISRLRSKVDKPFETALIKTVRGAGYTIDVSS